MFAVSPPINVIFYPKMLCRLPYAVRHLPFLVQTIVDRDVTVNTFHASRLYASCVSISDYLSGIPPSLLSHPKSRILNGRESSSIARSRATFGIHLGIFARSERRQFSHFRGSDRRRQLECYQSIGNGVGIDGIEVREWAVGVGRSGDDGPGSQSRQDHGNCGGSALSWIHISIGAPCSHDRTGGAGCACVFCLAVGRDCASLMSLGVSTGNVR